MDSFQLQIMNQILNNHRSTLTQQLAESFVLYFMRKKSILSYYAGNVFSFKLPVITGKKKRQAKVLYAKIIQDKNIEYTEHIELFMKYMKERYG